MDMQSRPFFSIGVTTYDRKAMLIDSINSILGQSFQDVEILVGNDYTLDVLSSASLSINDSRVIFINNPKNLGEMKNMNSLLEKSRGRYFTWLADDDLYQPNILKSVHKALVENDFPLAVFTSYSTGSEYAECNIEDSEKNNRMLTGRQFLREYLMRSIKTIGCYGFYDSDYLRRVGGMQKLGNGFSPYSDNFLAINAGLLHNLIFIDEPYCFFRTHEGSISYASPEVDAYKSAQHELLLKSIAIFNNDYLKEDFQNNLFSLLQWVMADYYSVILRSRRRRKGKWLRYLTGMLRYIRLLDKKRQVCIMVFAAKLSIPAALKNLIPMLKRNRLAVARDTSE